jgi:hypothetical protein
MTLELIPTEGPWEVHNGEITTPQIEGRSYRRIASVQDYGGGFNEVDKANAFQMAASPDLVAACKNALREIQDTLNNDYASPQDLQLVRNQLRSALAKAKGGS